MKIPNKFMLTEKPETRLLLNQTETDEFLRFVYPTAMQIFQAGWDGFHLIQTDEGSLLKLYDLEHYQNDWAAVRNGKYGKFLAGSRCYRIVLHGQTIIIHGDVAELIHRQMAEDDRYSQILNYMESFILPNPDQMEEYQMSEDELCSDGFITAAANILENTLDDNVPVNHTIESAIEQAAETWRTQRDNF